MRVSRIGNVAGERTGAAVGQLNCIAIHKRRVRSVVVCLDERRVQGAPRCVVLSACGYRGSEPEDRSRGQGAGVDGGGEVAWASDGDGGRVGVRRARRGMSPCKEVRLDVMEFADSANEREL